VLAGRKAPLDLRRLFRPSGNYGERLKLAGVYNRLDENDPQELLPLGGSAPCAVGVCDVE
jgi:hypothetical protein